MFEAQYISPKGANYGNIIVTKEFFAFVSLQFRTPKHFVYADHSISSQELGRKRIVLKWSEIDELWRVKCMQVRQGIEVSTCRKKCYTFNLLKEELCAEFFRTIDFIRKTDNNTKYGFELVKDPVETFRKKDFTGEWQQG